MILCHKCSGILAMNHNEDTSGMMECGCISGWVRGWEPHLDRIAAIREQITACENRERLYAEQGRPGFNNMEERANELRKLLTSD